MAAVPLAAASTRDALLAQAVQASADAVFCKDADGTITTWNPAAERIYGYRADEILGRQAVEVLPARTRAELADAHHAAFAGERVERFDTWHERSDGALMAVNVSVAPLRGVDGTVVAVATTVADISERIRLTRELEQARQGLQRQNAALSRSNRDLEQFAYVASHDLSEPLRVMTGYVEQLERRYDDVLDQRGRRYLQHIVDGATRMRALIDDLLHYSQFLKAPPTMELVDPNIVMDEVRRTLAGPLHDADAVLVVADLPPLWSDPAHVRSLLLNLVSNAAKFKTPGLPTRIEISASKAAGFTTLVVDDNGIGIEPDYRDRVFRMFQRLNDRESYAGTGIGLAIAQQIVELHEGRIWVEDSPLGGARFCCSMPSIPEERTDGG